MLLLKDIEKYSTNKNTKLKAFQVLKDSALIEVHYSMHIANMSTLKMFLSSINI